MPRDHNHDHDQNQNLTMPLPEDSFETHNCEPPSLEVTFQKEELLRMYMAMVTMRRMETTADTLYKSQLIRGFCHLCTGQVNKTSFYFSFVIIFSYAQIDSADFDITMIDPQSFFLFVCAVSDILIPGSLIVGSQGLPTRVPDNDNTKLC